jgi:hypothetical protein
MIDEMDELDVAFLREHIEKRSIKLDPSKKYTLKEIWGEEFRTEFTPNQRKGLGRLVSSLVEGNRLPLTAAGKNSSNANLYYLRT